MTNPYTVQTVRCAASGCMNVRRECNHWFAISVIRGDANAFYCRSLRLEDLHPDERPVCGQSCGQKLFEAWMLEQGK